MLFRSELLQSGLELALSHLKKFDAAIAAGDKAEATVAYTTAVKAVDQAAAKHLLHKNNASNKKSKMTTKLNGMA